MTIYHGSSVIVETPELRHSVRALDFGKGFYTTTNEEQAVQFARKIHERKIREGAENPGCFVSSYIIDYDALRNQLAILTFNAPNEEWFDFVMANRAEKYTGKKYDIIYGPVANDTVYRALVAYEAGLYTKKRNYSVASKFCRNFRDKPQRFLANGKIFNISLFKMSPNGGPTE